MQFTFVEESGQMNYYEILEVSPNASPEVIKAAYKSLMQRYHPDRNPGNAEAAKHSALVVQAYEVLSDSSLRAAYDIELKVRLANLNSVRVKARDMLAPVSRDDRESEIHWFLWLLSASIFLGLWLVLSPSEKKQSTTAEPKAAGPLLFGNQSASPQYTPSVRTIAVAAKTIPVFMRDLKVNLGASSESMTPSPAESRHVLSIQTVGIVIGNHEPDRFISFLEDHKDHISRKLAERLVSAEYETLNKHDGEGERYLKQFMLNSIGEITGTNRLEEYPSSGSGTPAHYGAVDILLPNSYTIE